MTGLELLKQEMINRGCTKAQCDSKAVLVVLDIVSKADGKYLLLAELESAIKSKRLEITRLQDQIEQLKIDRQKAKKEYEEMEQLRYNRKMQKLQETEDYKKKFFEALEQAGFYCRPIGVAVRRTDKPIKRNSKDKSENYK